MEFETAPKKSGRRQRRHDAGPRLTNARDYFQHGRYGERADGIASAPGSELNAVRWQVKSLESSRLVAPLDPRHELLYELLRLREEALAEIPARRRRGQAEQRASAGASGIAHRADLS